MLVEKSKISAGNVYDHTIDNKCSGCGDCCGLFIPFTEKELSVIKEYVKQHNIQPSNRVTKDGFIAQCAFLDQQTHRCKIYEVRPYACRDFRCNRKDWQARRDHYEKRAKYNSHLTKKKIIASFDDKVFDDYTPLIRYLTDMCKTPNGIDPKIFVALLKEVNRLDILDIITLYDENNKVVTKEQLLNE